MNIEYIHPPVAEEDGADEDDGWGEDAGAVDPAPDPAPPADRISQSRELARLQDAMATKRNGQRAADPAAKSREKDMFIPIVTVVSVVGFASLYGYEMLRLYSRGGLYLPWDR